MYYNILLGQGDDDVLHGLNLAEEPARARAHTHTRTRTRTHVIITDNNYYSSGYYYHWLQKFFGLCGLGLSCLEIEFGSIMERL